jgi:death on curing protein
MVYLDGEEVLRLHKVVIDFAGGTHGVRDAELLLSILNSPKQTVGGRVMYPDLWQKAAVYMEKFAKFHVFVDGNKRTALVATARFISLNGYRLKVNNDQAVKFVVSVVTKKLDVPTIAAWLKQHSKKSK